MQKILSAEEMREVDRLTTEKYGIPSILLMENAAHAAADVIKEKSGGSVAGKSFLILCGKGNNGGDGAALARILTSQGADVYAFLFGKVGETKGNAKINFEILQKFMDLNKEDAGTIFWDENHNSFYGELHSTIEIVNGIDVVVDALFGTGLTRPLDEALDSELDVIFTLLSYRKDKYPLIVSLDIPSGLNADSLEIFGKNIYAQKVHADFTVTFTAPKIANILPPASNFNGEIHVANIGSPQELIDNSPSQTFLAEKSDAQKWLERTKFTENSYKNKRGHALLIVGSKEYTGAAVLAGNAAMLSGVGLTTIATSESAQIPIAAKVLEEIITRGLPETKSGSISAKAFEKIEELFEKIDVVGIGCGLGVESPESSVQSPKSKVEGRRSKIEDQRTKVESSTDFVREVVTKRKTPVVIDADGLNALAPFDLKGSDELPLILTPHEGEFLRLLGTKDKNALKDRVKAVRDFAEKHRVILVLKGERTLIAAPDGRVVVNPTGNSGLGKAGNGDTLTGIMTGFVAQAVQAKVDIFETVVAAVYIAGSAGDIAAEKYGKRSMLASDVRESLSKAFQLIIKK